MQGGKTFVCDLRFHLGHFIIVITGVKKGRRGEGEKATGSASSILFFLKQTNVPSAREPSIFFSKE